MESNIPKVVSYGGLGDAWLVFIKLLEKHGSQKIDWTHINAHMCHHTPINEVQNLYPHLKCSPTTLVVPGGRPSDKFVDNFIADGGYKMPTTAKEIENSVADWSFLPEKFSALDNYIVVQSSAGRPHDNTKRGFSECFIRELAQQLNINVIVVGTRNDALEDCELYRDSMIFNYSGKTTIKEAISIIRGSKLTLAYDGLIAYVAMSLGIPTHVLWHAGNLPSHYMNEGWIKNTRQYLINARMLDKSFVANLVANIKEDLWQTK